MSLCYCINKKTGEYDLITIEEDPIFVASPAYTITYLDIAYWNSGGGGGGEPLFTARLAGPPNISIFTNDVGYITTRVETDPVFSAWLSSPPNISIFTNDAGYITSRGPETDPVFAARLLGNPFSGYVPYVGATNDVVIGEHSVIVTNDGVIVRDVDELFQSVTLSSGRVMTATRDIDKKISTLFDGVRTRTFTRTLGRITSRVVTP